MAGGTDTTMWRHVQHDVGDAVRQAEPASDNPNLMRGRPQMHAARVLRLGVVVFGPDNHGRQIAICPPLTITPRYRISHHRRPRNALASFRRFRIASAFKGFPFWPTIPFSAAAMAVRTMATSAGVPARW